MIYIIKFILLLVYIHLKFIIKNIENIENNYIIFILNAYNI